MQNFVKLTWLYVIIFHPSWKCQLISKGLCGVFNSSKKRMQKFCPSRLGRKLKILVRFLEELMTANFPFEINWPLDTQSCIKRPFCCTYTQNWWLSSLKGNQLFRVDTTKYRNSDFTFVLPMKIWKKNPFKVHRIL